MANSDDDAPGKRYFTPTLADVVTVDPAGPFRAVWVGVAGNLVIVDYSGTAHTFVGVPIGLHPLGGIRIQSTNTTATTFICVSANAHQS